MIKCDYCGKKLGFLDDGHAMPTKSIDEVPKTFCDECYKRWFNQQKERKEVNERRIIEEKVQKIEKTSIPESELLLMIHNINKEQKKFLSEIHENVETLTRIMIFYLILFLISFIITIILPIIALS